MEKPQITALVISDTHENIAFAEDLIATESPDVIIHLGDHSSDADEIKSDFPEIPMYSVRGNCDLMSFSPDRDVVPLGPVKAFITHGHLYNVRYGVDSLVYAAQEADCKIAIFGHTHTPYHEDIGGVKVINPGTAGKGRKPTAALLEVYDNGAVGVTFLE